MKCPIDNIDLVMSERAGIEIDYCPTCRGVWLDRGELNKIIERSSDTVLDHHPHPQRSEPRHGEERHSQYHGNHHKKHKKESWLGEIFDF